MKYIRLIVIIVIFIVLALGVKGLIKPRVTVILTGSFDPTTTYVYIDNTRITTKDLGVRTFTYGKTGTYPVLVSGPGIKAVKTSLSIKPLLGGKVIIAVSAGDSARTVVQKTLGLKDESGISSARQFDGGWIGAIVDGTEGNSLSYALQYDYEKASWVLTNPDGLFDTSKSTYKNAPKDLVTFLTDVAGD
ncbi:MAG: hypothetical protein JWO47_982 [Candidatus Saccharibacteria bacterium]|nr:hypothetical protein [Candidatus Saccharibacteria bacterium]